MGFSTTKLKELDRGRGCGRLDDSSLVADTAGSWTDGMASGRPTGIDGGGCDFVIVDESGRAAGDVCGLPNDPLLSRLKASFISSNSRSHAT